MNEDTKKHMQEGQRRSEDNITRHVTEEQKALERRIMTLCTHKLVAIGLGEYSLSRLQCMTTDELSAEIDNLRVCVKLTTRIMGEHLNVGTCQCGREYDVVAMYPRASLECKTLNKPSIIGLPRTEDSDDEV